MAPFMAGEVKLALDAIGDLKAPGPDGMTTIFYKKFWEVVGGKITEEVMIFLQGVRCRIDGMRQSYP